MNSAYPKYFKTPEGRAVSIKSLANAMRVIRANPGADYPGWNWFLTPGHHIIKEVRRGIHHRINMRGNNAST